MKNDQFGSGLAALPTPESLTEPCADPGTAIASGHQPIHLARSSLAIAPLKLAGTDYRSLPSAEKNGPSRLAVSVAIGSSACSATHRCTNWVASSAYRLCLSL